MNEVCKLQSRSNGLKQSKEIRQNWNVPGSFDIYFWAIFNSKFHFWRVEYVLTSLIYVSNQF